MFKLEKCFRNSASSFKLPVQYLVILSVFINAIKDGACVIPEASQEGVLRSFKTYEDVIMFHFNVPNQILRATWQFAAFMDSSKCPQRTVNIFLKWGSYPVISTNNVSYPDNMFIESNQTIKISTVTNYELPSMTIVPVYSPLPGDWFVGAYLSPWDEKVHPKGLGHECHYNLGSVALWSQTTGIQNIPLGYQKTVKTSETISYYKIYIPMDTRSFQVDIWGCNSTLKTVKHFNGLCIKNLALKGRVLPYHNHSNPSTIGNLTSMDTYTFTELSPFQDSWYYLMVVSNSKIYFNIKVTVFDCPIRTMEEGFIQQHIDIPLNAKAFSSLYSKKLKEKSLQWYSINESEIKRNSTSISYKQTNTEEDSNDLDSCVLRYQLIRIKYSDTFSADYLLRGREWLTSWLALSDTIPVITQFDILPLVDIGGTLDISIGLEMNEFLFKHQVNVTICINRGRMPTQEKGHILCDNKYLMMQLSSSDTQNASLLIPYPQPDTWYIALQATCYVNGMPARCQMEEILVSLRVKLRACVSEGSNSCGQYGICREIHKGPLYYSACECFRGCQGWACTDTSNAISKLSVLLTALALTLSNLFFLPAIYLAFKRHLYTEGLIYFSTMLFSGLYHACDQESTTYCVAKYEVLQYCDFFSGILSFWVTFVAMAELPIQYVSFCHMLGAIIITFVVESDKTSIYSVLTPMVIGVQIPMTSYLYICYKMKKIVQSKRMMKLIIGLSLAVFGILLFSLVETESNYKYVHSCWHVIIALSLIFLLPPERENHILNNVNELLKDSPDNSVFNIESNQPNHLMADIN